MSEGAAKPARAGSRSRRKIFSCPVCDEVFIDEESLRRHELTHQNPEAEGEAPPPEAPAPPPTPAADDSPSAVQEAPESPPPRARPLSSVRRQAAQQQAQVEAEANFLPPEAPLEMPVDPDATLKVENPTLQPLGWEGAATKSSGGGLGLGPLWAFVEDFSEWFVRGSTKTAGVVGFSVLSGVGLAIRGLLLLGMAALCVYAGIWFGRVYGPRLWGGPSVDRPVVPPTRTIPNSPAAIKQSVRDLVTTFYDAISNKDYKQAYGCLSPAFQKFLSYDTFANGYKNIQAIHCEVRDVSSMAGGKYRIDLVEEVTEKGKRKRTRILYEAIPSAGGWRLDSGTVVQQ